MAAMTKAMCVALIAVVMVVAAAPPAEAAINCDMVISFLRPYHPWVSNKGPLGRCCGGVKGLNGAAKSTPDRQRACSCLKSIAARYHDIILSRAAILPQQCGVNIPYKISLSTDCSKVR
ncbi:non-specific lipid-transfer protein 2-like [Salvia miltiorrhiza]|uniref:non-specific lipid-transfer protein 2-like n=1 Tax=Salvia miltiorrhiza TaxID=226208 RepID=UPI0025AC2538|nr:non-specific lipid-transfer protein 2-like [Salvia miltiorrhiza]